MSSSQYRPDIDGLRAIAVLSVVCFHAFPSLLKGGFVGVDIFFVISGFLITKILLENLASNTFSFADFYSRRIKRIFPALIFVLISCYLFGWFILLGDEYKQLGKHMFAGAGFFSNFTLWGEAGYFDNAAETKPFLHLWSLAIEEQFYIIWPLLLWLGWKRKFNLLILILAITLISFAVNASQVHRFRIEAFYSPITRFWELLTGALLAYFRLNPSKWAANIALRFKDKSFNLSLSHEEKKLADYQSLFGFILITIALLVINKQKDFPGWWALLPCIGSFHIIAAGPQAWLNRVILSNRILVWFGLISYPLYLWHWPLLSFGKIILGEIPLAITQMLVILSIILSWITYRFIEKPLRFNQQNKAKVGLILTMCLIGFAGFTTYKNNGFTFRMKDSRADYADFFENTYPGLKYIHKQGIGEKYRDECNFFNVDSYQHQNLTRVPRPSIEANCYTPKTDLSILIWGDSHGQHLYHGLKKTLPKDISILQVASSGCPLAWIDRAVTEHDDYCTVSNQFALNTIRNQHPNIVILAQSMYLEKNINLDRIVIELKKMGIEKILILGPVPCWNIALHKLVLNKYWNYLPRRISNDLNPDNLLSDQSLKKKYSNDSNGVTYVSLRDFFCNSKGCLTYVGKNSREGLTTWDQAHLSPRASIFLAQGLLGPLILSALEPHREQLAKKPSETATI